MAESEAGEGGACCRWWVRLCADESLAKRVTVVAVAVVVASWAAVIAFFDAQPAEDAFILFRYAEHWASGHGIVWNVGGPRAEGATDFLWLALVTALTPAVGAVRAAMVVGGAFVVATAAWIAVVAVRHHRMPVLVAGIGIAAYLSTPILIHWVNGFSPPMFAFLLVVGTTGLVRLLAEERHASTPWMLGVTLLLIGLTRPEGNAFNVAVMAVLTLDSLTRRRPGSWRWVIAIMVGYALPGAVYFVARWQYFGLPFPLPSYVKAPDVHGVAAILGAQTWTLAVHLGFPLALVALTLLRGVRASASTRAVALAAIPPVALLLCYLPFVQSQNISDRFQYSPYLALVFLAVLRVGFELRAGALRSGGWRTGALFAAVAWASLTAVPLPEVKDDTAAAGKLLRPYAAAGCTVATTEAGRLPFYSTWRTLDPYGLNDGVVARSGLSYDHWRSFSPDVVMIHTSKSWNPESAALPAENVGNRRTLMEFMRRDGTYELVASIGRRGRSGRLHRGDYSLYFVAPHCPKAREIRDALRRISEAAPPQAVADYLRLPSAPPPPGRSD